MQTSETTRHPGPFLLRSHFLVVEISISSYGADIFECINGLSSRLLVDVGSSYDFFAESVNQKILLTVRVRGFHVGSPPAASEIGDFS